MTVRPIANYDPGTEWPPDWHDDDTGASTGVDRIMDGLPQPPAADLMGRTRPGGSFILDAPERTPAVWGEGTSILWAEGEPLLLVGPTGVGKTTLAGQIIRARLGISTDVLGYPLRPTARRVLYLAMDRPQQARRNLARIFTDDDREVLDDALVVHEGPPPLDVGRHPNVLVDMAVAAGADTVVVDSLKDAAVKLTDDEVGGNVNRALQLCVTHGIETLALHHQKKGQNGSRPNTLEDVYGSTWLTAGAGSVGLLWGQAGDPLVDFVHLKQPADTVGPLKVEHHLDGTSTVYAGFDPVAFLRNRPGGATAIDAARAMTEKADPSDLDRKKAQRKLDRLVATGMASKSAGQRGGSGGSSGAVYRLAVTAGEGQ